MEARHTVWRGRGEWGVSNCIELGLHIIYMYFLLCA